MKKLLFILILFCSIQGFGQIKGMWRLDGNSNDASGSGNNGTDTNITYSQANGRLNQGAGFNGSNSKIYNFSSNISPSGSSRTISVWFKTGSTVRQGLAGTRAPSEPPYVGWVLTLNQGSTANGLSYFHTGVGSNVWSGYTIPLNTWVYGTVTYDYTNQIAKIYINGILKISQSLGRDNASTRKGCIGQEQESNTEVFNGSIDEVIIDNTVWSPAKIKNYYLLTSQKFPWQN